MEKKTAATRVLIYVALLMLVGGTALARDTKSSTITINGGRTTVNMKAPSKMVNHAIKAPASPFYDNIGNTGYTAGVGWTVSDGSPIGTEYTPGNQIVSLKSGRVHKISVGVGFVTGTNGGIVVLDKDCAGIPCGTIDKTHMCKGKISNLYVFGQSSTQTETIKCGKTVKLKKGKPYWVYIQSLSDSWLAWNLSLTATGGLIEGTDDVWGSPSSGQPVGALTIQ